MARVVLENVRVDFPIYGAQQRSLRNAIVQRATGGLIHREGRSIIGCPWLKAALVRIGNFMLYHLAQLRTRDASMASAYFPAA
jgi:hypothetical protein